MRALTFAAGAVGAALAVGGLGLASGAIGQAAMGPSSTSSSSTPPPTPVEVLTGPVLASSPNAAQLERGRYLVVSGDCVACHTREGGAPLSGGLGLNTPFGTIYTPNLTSDARTGMGRWTPDQFYRAMHEGVGAHGEELYPAFPYTYFTGIRRADTDAMLAYLKTVPAVDYTPPGNRLPFPLNIRFMVHFWNLLFFKPHAIATDPSKSAMWNRGAYLVAGAGHCGQCHTQTNVLGASENSRAFRGGLLDNWVAPDLTRNARTGLGHWSSADVVEYLKTGRNVRAQAGGPMAEVVSYSTSLMTDADLAAMATYLKDLPASPMTQVGDPDPAVMKRGAAVYSDACASCHLEKGVGQPRYFPPMAGDAVAQQSDPSSLTHAILAGVQTGPTATRPTGLAMPSFAWKLSDAEIGDVSTYVRNSWGNRAPAVSASQVTKMRRSLKLATSTLTANSGDHG